MNGQNSNMNENDNYSPTNNSTNDIVNSPIQPEQQVFSNNANVINNTTVGNAPNNFAVNQQNQVPQQSEYNQNIVNNQLNSQYSQTNIQQSSNQSMVNPTNLSVANVAIGQQQTQVVNPTVSNGGVISPSTPIDKNFAEQNVGFIEQGKPLKKKIPSQLKLGIALCIVVLFSLLGYFVIYPFVMKTFFSDPKTVYMTTIDKMEELVSSSVSDVVKNHSIWNAQASIDSNVPSLNFLNNFTFSGKIGFDPQEELFEIGYNIIDSRKNDVGQMYYIKNHTYYTRYSTYRDLIYAGAIEDSDTQDLFEMFQTLLNESNRLSNEDSIYMVNALFKAFKNSFVDAQFAKEESSIVLNGESIKVLKHDYLLNKQIIESMNSSIREELANDEKFVDSYANLMQYDKNAAKNAILEKDYSYTRDGEVINVSPQKLNIDENFSGTFTIYTYGNNLEFIGFAYENSNNMKMNYYNHNGYIDGYLENEDDHIVIKGSLENGKTNVSILNNDNKLADLSIESLQLDKIVFDYTIYVTENNKINNYSGNFSFDKVSNDSNLLYNLKAKLIFPDNKYISLTSSISNDWKSDVANINTASAVTLTQEELNNIIRNYQQELLKTPIGSFYSTISDFASDSVMDYYNDFL